MKRKGQVVELDVRPHLRKKLEPFQLIMETVKGLDINDTFILHATFKPTPLLTLLKTKGYRNTVEKLASDHWQVTFVHKKADRSGLEEVLQEEEEEPEVVEVVEEVEEVEGQTSDAGSIGQIYELDNRGLEPPQPMIRTLTRLEKAKSGDIVRIHNDRVPMFLIEELKALGYEFEIEEQANGSAKVTIRKT